MPSNEALESKQTEESPSNSPAPESEKKSEDSKLGEDESKIPESSAPTIDFKAMLEEEKAKLQRAEEKIVKLKKLGKKDVPSTNEDEDEEVPEEKVSRLVADQIEKVKDEVRREIVESEVDDLISELSSNSDERQLIRHIYENRLQKSGYSRSQIREDLENAKVLANKTAILKSNKELSEALKSKVTTTTAPNFVSGTRATEKSGPTYSAKERALLEKYGVKI